MFSTRISTPFFVLALAASAQASQINGSAVQIKQLSFPTQPFSQVGEITVDYALAGGSGFVNVLRVGTSDWLVRNLPVFDEATGFDFGSLTTRFDLSAFTADGVAAPSSIQLVIDFDVNPSSTVGEVIGHGTPGAAYSTAEKQIAKGGTNPIPIPIAGAIPDLTDVAFLPANPNIANFVFQKNHPNVQAAYMQCAPMAIANSLQFLENTTTLVIPEPHNLGFGLVLVPAPNGTLVGYLDNLTQRTLVVDRLNLGSSGVWPLDGKMDYIAAKAMGPVMQLEYLIGGNSGYANQNLPVVGGNQSYAHAGLTAAFGGANFTMNWLLGKLNAGAGVEFDIAFNGGGMHYVVAIGAGRIKGQPFLLHISDMTQAPRDLANDNIADNEGCTQIDFEWVKELGGKVLNSNGVINQMLSTQYVDPFVVFCPGDGTGAACPCGNNSAVGANEGCLSSLGTGGKLRAVGTPSITVDTMVLHGSQMPNSSALYFQGTAQVGAGAGVVFGDGLRCAGGAITRLGTKFNAGGASQYPAAGEFSISIRGMIAIPGTTRTYQCWYRNAAAFCLPATFNLSNGLQTTWLP